MAAAEDVSVQSAFGFVLFGAKCLKGYCWPGGQFSHTITGSGYRITYQGAEANDLVGAGLSGKQFCNWRINFVDYDGNGKVVRKSTGPLRSGCTLNPVGRVVNTDRTASRSTVKSCAILYNNGADEVVRQCHSIKP